MRDITNICLCAFGLILAFFYGFFCGFGGIGTEANQKQPVIPVLIGGLRQQDIWLTGAKAYLAPMTEIRSARRYSVLILTPPGQEGSGKDLYRKSIVLLENQESGTEQPIEIASTDFGPNSDQVAVKLIDDKLGPGQPYKLTDKLFLTSRLPNGE